MRAFNCPNCSTSLKRQIHQDLVAPFKTFIALTCPECHKIRQVDITKVTAGMMPEEATTLKIREESAHLVN